MRKIYLFQKFLAALIILSFSSVAIGQDNSTPDKGYNSHGSFGIRGGVTISKQQFDEGNLSEDPKTKFGADVGLIFSLPLGNGTFMLQPELHWMQKGSKISDINGAEVTSTLNYLELPVLLRLNFGGSTKLFVLGGVSAGYLLGGSFKGGSVDEDVKEVFNDLDYAGHLGVGIGLGPIEIDVRYMAGLSDISSSEFNLGKTKNSSFGAGVTLKF